MIREEIRSPIGSAIRSPFALASGSPWALDATAEAIRAATLDLAAWAGTGWRLPGGGGVLLPANARASVAMQQRVGGGWEFAAHNLLTHSEAFDNAAWSKAAGAVVVPNAGIAPNGTMTADLLYPTVAGSVRAIWQAANGANAVSVYAKAAGANTLSVIDQSGATYIATFNLVTGIVSSSGAGVVATIEPLEDGWHRCIVSSTTGQPFVLAQFATQVAVQSGTDGVLLWGAAGARGSVSNLLASGEAFDDAVWSKQANALVTPNAGAAPDGNMTADLLYPAIAGSVRALFQPANGATIVSVYAKAAGANTLSVVNQSGASYIATFNLATGVVQSSGAGVRSRIVPVGSGWYHCLVESTTGQPFVLAQFATQVAVQSGTDGVLLWRARGSLDVAYVPTDAAARFGPAFSWQAAVAAWGMHSEPAATNRVLWARDLTQAVWTKTNATATRTATGVDGEADTASVLTATAANATALQAITDASRERTLSILLRRRTGTGTVETTIDGGATWVPRTLTAAWQRFRTTVTSANPIVGVRIVVSGDAVDVDIVQEENGPRDTSPIITGSATVTRAEDTAASAYALGAAATLVVDYVPALAGSQTVLGLDDGTPNERVLLGNDGVLTVTDGGVAQATPDGGTPVVGAVNRIAARVAANDFAVSLNGGAVATDTSGTMPAATTLRYGVGANVHILRARVRSGTMGDVQLQGLSA